MPGLVREQQRPGARRGTRPDRRAGQPPSKQLTKRELRRRYGRAVRRLALLATVIALAGCGGDDKPLVVFAASPLSGVAEEVDPAADVVAGELGRSCRADPRRCGGGRLPVGERGGARRAARRRRRRGADGVRIQQPRDHRAGEEHGRRHSHRRPDPEGREARPGRGRSAGRRPRPPIARAGRPRCRARERRRPRGGRESHRRQGRRRRGRCGDRLRNRLRRGRRRRSRSSDLRALPAEDRLLRGDRLTGLRRRRSAISRRSWARRARRRFGLRAFCLRVSI